MFCCIPVSAFTLCKDVEEDGGKSGGGIEEGVKGQGQGQRSGPDKGRDKGPEPGPGGIDRMCAVRFSPSNGWKWMWKKRKREGSGRLMEARALERREERNKQIHKACKQTKTSRTDISEHAARKEG